jgi:CBS domain containing-hemolysin-like protein
MAAILATAIVTVFFKVLADVIAKHWETWIVWFAPPFRLFGRLFNALAEWCEKRGVLIVARIGWIRTALRLPGLHMSQA